MNQLAERRFEAGSQNQDAKAKQFLTFELKGECYGVEILRVQEIMGWKPVTVVPNVPDYVKGVLNLRGVVAPIIDLRKRFGIEAEQYTQSTVIIVLLLESGDGEKTYGIVVDEVSDVVDVTDESIRQIPEFDSATNRDYLTSIATVEEKMIMLLDANKIVSSSEVDQLAEADNSDDHDADA